MDRSKRVAAGGARNYGQVAREPIDLYRLLVERVQDYAIFALDPQGYILSWNEGAARLKGYSAEEIIGQHFSIFYPAEAVAAGKTVRMLEQAVAAGQVEDEGWRVRKDGSLFWANVVITPVRDSDGELAGFAKVTRDLTERRAAHERALADARRIAAEEAARETAEQRAGELRRLTQQLRAQSRELARRSEEAESANRAKSEFLAAMSHELRTPLNAIGGYAQLLQLGVSGPLTQGQREHVDRIQRSQQHLLSIINDLLNFSRIEAGKVGYDIGPVPLHEVAHSVVPMITPQALAKRVQLKIGTCPQGVMGQADRPKVEQIVLNLLSNAVKFTAEGGEIEVTCGASGDRAWLSVRDSGIGIAPEQIEAVFAPFVQVGRTLANPKEGAGLGLAISRELARAMHGDLTVDSREGDGSTFTLVLPRASSAGNPL